LTHDLRVERRRVRLFFAGLMVVSAVLDIVGALLIQHQTRSQVLEGLLPASITLGGRTGAVLSGLALLLLAGGIARGKRVAFRLALVVLVLNIGFDLVKDLDFEAGTLLAWILFGLWLFRSHFEADSDPLRVRWGLAALASGLLLAVVYAIFGIEVLANQLSPEAGPVQTLESLAKALVGNPTQYRALTERANWFLGTLPVVSYALVLFALVQLLRPVLAPRAAAAERERVHRLLVARGRNTFHTSLCLAPRVSTGSTKKAASHSRSKVAPRWPWVIRSARQNSSSAACRTSSPTASGRIGSRRFTRWTRSANTASWHSHWLSSARRR
jgi:lysylphosphatidylglycerol synthetase-like protein (DUF2156 family)